MVIKDGFNGFPWEIIITGREKGASELWIKLKEPLPTKDEVLLYITTTELVALRDELNNAIRDAVGL